MILRCVSETATELVDKVYIHPIIAALLIFVLGFSIAYIAILFLNNETKNPP